MNKVKEVDVKVTRTKSADKCGHCSQHLELLIIFLRLRRVDKGIAEREAYSPCRIIQQNISCTCQEAFVPTTVAARNGYQEDFHSFEKQATEDPSLIRTIDVRTIRTTLTFHHCHICHQPLEEIILLLSLRRVKNRIWEKATHAPRRAICTRLRCPCYEMFIPST